MRGTKLLAAAMLAAFVMGGSWAGAAIAASFNCRRAATADEVAICSDPLLSELDEIMADFYVRLRHYSREFDNAMGLQARLRGQARDFLKNRAACGANTSCLEDAYRQRILQLLDMWRRAME
jgi:uncharacterized protein